jgi:hypothetical protein
MANVVVIDHDLMAVSGAVELPFDQIPDMVMFF